MSDLTDFEALVTALTAVPEHKTELPPYYPLLAAEKSLTLKSVLKHKKLLRNHDDLGRNEIFEIQKVTSKVPPIVKTKYLPKLSSFCLRCL